MKLINPWLLQTQTYKSYLKALINGNLALGAQMNAEIVSNIHFLFVQLQCKETLQNLECSPDHSKKLNFKSKPSKNNDKIDKNNNA